MSRPLFVIIAVCLSFARLAYAQNCSLYPNSQVTLSEYGVRSIIVTAENYGSPKKEIEAIYYLDSTGCAWKWISRRLHSNRYTYYINEERGSLLNGKKESYSAYFDKDSSEKLIERRIDHFLPDGRRVREERWYVNNENVFRNITYFGAFEPNIIDRLTVILTEKGDTTARLINKSDSTGSLSVQLIKEGQEWKEKHKTITKIDSTGLLRESIRWQDGKIVDGRKYEAIRKNGKLTEVIESDLDGKPRRKTVYSDKKGDHLVYEFREGKWVFIEEVLMPEDDPIEESKDHRIEEVQTGKEKSVNKNTHAGNRKDEKKSISVREKKYKRLSNEPAVEKITYSDPLSRSGIIMKQRFTAEGLILETDIVRDKKKLTYTYEFFK